MIRVGLDCKVIVEIITLNFVISPEIVSIEKITDEGDFVERLTLETLTGLPTTRTLSAEWTGNGIIFAIEESEISHVMFCKEPSGFELLFAGIRPGGSLQGYIEDVKIWQSEE